MNLRFSPPITGITAAIGSLFGRGPGKKDDTDGKVIDVDRDGNTLFKEDIIHNILEELEKRRAEWKPLPPRVTTGYLAKYASMGGTASHGARVVAKL